MVQARNLQLLHRQYCDAYGDMLSSSTFISAATDIAGLTKSRLATTPVRPMSTPFTSMAQEPHNPTAQDHDDKQEQEQLEGNHQQQQQQQQQQQLLLQEEVGTSTGSTSRHSNNNSSGNTNTTTATTTTTVSKDWLQLGLAPSESPETAPARQGPGPSALSPAFLSMPAMPIPMPRGAPTWMTWSQPLPPQPFVMPQFMATRADMRVVVLPPSPRPNTSGGIWFLLQAAQNLGRESFLPQIPKSFLRIKDGRVTVRLLIKYLVNKLGLDDESEVEITCRGRTLLPFLTLQHVRDNIWCPRDIVSVPPDLSTTNHVMTLQYGRSL